MTSEPEELEDHDKGLAFDMPKLISRRRALGVLAGTLTTAALAACGGSSSSSDGSAATAAPPTAAARSPRRPAARSRATAPTGRTS